MRSKLNLKRTRNKLLKNGYLPEDQESYREKWIDVRRNGAPISFGVRDDKVDGSLRVHGRTSKARDRFGLEADEHYSDYTRNVKEAIELSRAHCD